MSVSAFRVYCHNIVVRGLNHDSRESPLDVLNYPIPPHYQLPLSSSPFPPFSLRRFCNLNESKTIVYLFLNLFPFFSQISEKNAFSTPKQVHKIVKARLYPIPPSPGLLPPSFSQVQFTLCISVLAIPESDTTLSILHLFEPEGVLMTKLQVFFDVREVFRAM